MSVEKLWDETHLDGRALIRQGSVKLTDPSQTANGKMGRSRESGCE